VRGEGLSTFYVMPIGILGGLTMINDRDMKSLKDAVELLLQCMELLPAAQDHVEQYISYKELVNLQDALKASGSGVSV
jgi:hypothetical protein